ncbi:Flagellar hook protein FlgE [compost metagenome]
MSDIRTTATNSLQSIDHWLKALAGNLTGSNVVGYRSTRVQFQEVLVDEIRAGAPALANQGAVNPMQYAVGGTQLKATKTDFSQGALTNTGSPTDLAINGNGFFVLSKVPNPTSMADLVFTRAGSFSFQSFVEPNKWVPQSSIGTGTQGVYRLVDPSTGYFVMGAAGNYQPPAAAGLPGEPRPPAERSGNGTSLGDLPTSMQFKPLEIPFIHDTVGNQSVNADNIANLRFLSTGIVVDANGEPPLGIEMVNGSPIKKPIDKYVALASFTANDGLSRNPGGTSFDYTQAAGAYNIGVAATRSGVLGNSELVSQNLETGNSSVNQTLPELTIAQKAFTANVKIISVGNTLQDDLNQLIR